MKNVGFIYFIQMGDGGPIKVGYSKDTQNLAKRLSMLQVGSVDRLFLRIVCSGSRDEERRLHKVLADHRLRGEWFQPSEAVYTAMYELKSVDIEGIDVCKPRLAPAERLAASDAIRHWRNTTLTSSEALNLMPGWSSYLAIKQFGPRAGPYQGRYTWTADEARAMARKSHAARNANTADKRMPIADARAIWHGHPTWSNEDCIAAMPGWTLITAYRRLGARGLAKGRPRMPKQHKP